MILGEDYQITLGFDLVAFMILFGMCLIPKDKREGRDTGVRIFVSMAVCIVLGIIFELIRVLMPEGVSKFGIYVVVIADVIVELLIAALLFLFFLYMDYKLYASRDHQRRHIVLYLMPAFIFVILCLLWPVTRKLFGTDTHFLADMYYYSVLMELAYLFMTAVHLIKYYIVFGKKPFFHPFSIYAPVLCGAVITYYLGYNCVFLGFAIGMGFMAFSSADSRRFIDKDTAFFNRAYLGYVREMLSGGTLKRSSMILFEAKGDRMAFSDILRTELPAHSEVVCLEDGRFVFLSDTGSMTELKALSELVRDGVDDYDGSHSDKILLSDDIQCRVFKDGTAAAGIIQGL